MKALILISLLILSFNACIFSQNIITVRNKHSKELIHTLKEGEYLGRGESKIMIDKNAVGYEFIIENSTRRSTTYKNGKKLGEFPNYHFSSDESWISDIEINGQKKYYLNYKSGKKIGPYDYVNSISNYSDVKSLDYRYENEGKTYIYVNKENKTYGPYDKVDLQNFSNENINFRYLIGTEWFIYQNGKITGPYKDYRVPYLPDKNMPFYYTFKNEENEWKVFYKEVLDFSFNSSPEVTIFENGKIMLKGSEINGSGGEYYFIDGKKYPAKYKDKEIYSNSIGDILRVNVNRISSKEELEDSIFIENKYIRSYKTSYMYKRNCKKSLYFNVFFIDKTEVTKDNIYIYKKNEFVFVGKENDFNEGDFYLAGNDFIYLRKTDNTLIINGKESQHKNVFYLNYDNYPEEVIMGKKVGKYDVFYLNGKELSYEEIQKKKLYIEWYNIKGKPFTFETINEKTFVSPKNSTKKFGPVRENNKFVFSKNNEHYGECNDRTMEIFIDGKLFSPGFCLTYNANTNAFHWLSLDKDKLYLHTFNN